MKKNHVNLKLVFIEFLKDNGIYDRFFDLVALHLNKSKKFFLKEYFTATSAICIFNFIPSSLTREGLNYWHNMQQKWRKYLFKQVLPLFIYELKKHKVYKYAVFLSYKEDVFFKILERTPITSYPCRLIYNSVFEKIPLSLEGHVKLKKFENEWKNVIC